MDTSNVLNYFLIDVCLESLYISQFKSSNGDPFLFIFDILIDISIDWSPRSGIFWSKFLKLKEEIIAI